MSVAPVAMAQRHAVEQTTRELLTERDPAGEVVHWLKTIAEMATFSG